jgi:hypothetical protein
MREILFNAKDLKGDWVEGYYAYNLDDYTHIIYTTKDRFAIEVAGETVCQFIKKHNEVSIWENDKFGEDEEGYYAIQWSDRNCSFIVNYFDKDGKLTEENCMDINDLLQYYEPTGNIHD